MIVIPAALLSAPPDGVSLKNARIGYQTWLRDLTASAVTVSSETEDGPRDAPLRPDTFEFWEPSALPATWVVDMGTARAVDYVGVYGMIGSLGVSVKVEFSSDNSSWEQFSDEISQGSDAPMMFLDDAVTKRYMRLTLAGTSDVMPRVAVVYAGEVLAMERKIYGGHAPLPLNRRTKTASSKSRGGQFLGQHIQKMGVETTVSFQHLTAAWYRANFDPFVKVARSFPYFFAWNPLQHSNEVGYVTTEDDIHPSNMGVRDFMQVSFPMEGVGYE